MNTRKLGQEALEKKGWLRANTWLLLRRFSQVGILGLFLLGPWAGFWLIQGSLSASTVLGLIPMTDPLLMVQSLVTGHRPQMAAVLGFFMVVALYMLLGGRVFCAWVCPVNIVTDAAAWVNRRLEKKQSLSLSKATRYWFLAFLVLTAALSSSLVWESVNPVTAVHRGLVFGMGWAWVMVLALFLLDAILLRHGWCGHLCPVGASYSLLGFFPLLRVQAAHRQRCTDCMDCLKICPEPQVIFPALKGEGSSLIRSPNCLTCGRCIDICPQNVFVFSKKENLP
jgi:ferredoxin-type protein NapH